MANAVYISRPYRMGRDRRNQRALPRKEHRSPFGSQCIAHRISAGGCDKDKACANTGFLKSERLNLPGIKPNSGHRDYSRLSCGGGETQLGPSAGISAASTIPVVFAVNNDPVATKLVASLNRPGGKPVWPIWAPHLEQTAGARFADRGLQRID
jgi:hypothetical protein